MTGERPAILAPRRVGVLALGAPRRALDEGADQRHQRRAGQHGRPHYLDRLRDRPVDVRATCVNSAQTAQGNGWNRSALHDEDA